MGKNKSLFFKKKKIYPIFPYSYKTSFILCTYLPDNSLRAFRSGGKAMGPCCSKAKAFMKDLGSKLVELSGEKRATEFWRQIMAFPVPRGNAVACT